MTAPVAAHDLVVAIDFHGLYLFGLGSPQWDADPYNTTLAADVRVVAGKENTAHVGAAAGMLHLATPTQFSEGVPFRVEVWSTEPPAKVDLWQNIVDVDLDIPEGVLVVETPGGGGDVQADVGPDRYRARIHARGWSRVTATETADVYLLQLWPRAAPSPMAALRTWAPDGP